MTFAEVYRELARDREAVGRWWQHQVDGLRRQMIKRDRNTFPVGYSFRYTSPRRIRYIFIALIGDKRLKTFHHTCVAHDGMTVYTSWLHDSTMVRPNVMLPHMWQRYAERMGFTETGYDLIGKFFARNFSAAGTRNQDIVARSVRYNGEEHLTVCVNDGVMMGKMDGGIYVAKTFITYEMAYGRQQEEFARIQHEIDSPGLKVHEYYRYLPTPDLPPIPKAILDKINKKQ